MKRRTLLRATGVGILGGLAGCSGGTDDGPTTGTPTETGSSGGAPFEHPGTLEETFATNGDFPPDDDPADGRPPEFADPSVAPDVDASSFETLEVDGETVRLAPIDVVVDWYRRGEARMVDARGLGQYTQTHVFGAVLSTYRQGSTGGAIDGWNPDDRVVTYCRCPHHQSSIRAAGLQKAGFSTVFAIDEGFDAWADRGYPMAGTSFESSSRASLSEWAVSGSVPTRYAGEYAHAAATQQYEAAPIDSDGSYRLDLHFWDVSAETPVTVSTPHYTVTRPLGELSSTPVDGT